MKASVSLKYLVSDCPWKQFALDPFKLDLFETLSNSKAFHTVLT